METFTSRKHRVIACGIKRKQLSHTQMFTVIDGFTHTPIGVFDDYDKAKLSSETITNNKFIILAFDLNKECTYHINNMYESPELIQKE
jgi:hypothetical protein